jgi:AbrB family looped-hinge helix DNA binding protein
MRTAKAFGYPRTQTSVTVSPKFQVVIPKAIRESMGLKPGMWFEVNDSGDIIELVPVPAPGKRPRASRPRLACVRKPGKGS